MSDRLPSLIEPFDERQIVNCAYELTMGDQAFVTGVDRKTRQCLGEDEQVRIPPGQTAQLLTREIVRVPDDALGLISIKSKLKLRGLVNVSGFHVDPGYKGRLLFSVYNAGSHEILISVGKPTFLLWCSSLDKETKDLYCDRQPGQYEISDEVTMSLSGETYTPQALAARVKSLEGKVKTQTTIVLTVLGAIVVAFVLNAIGLY